MVLEAKLCQIMVLQAILRQVHWMTPKLPWTLKGQRYPIHIYYNYLWVPNFTSFCSMACRFLDTDNFDISAPNDPITTLSTKRAKVDHNHVTHNFSQVQNFTLFRPTTSRFPDTAHFETSVLNDPKMTLNSKRSNFKVPHIHMLQLPPTSKFHTVCSTWGPAVFDIKHIKRHTNCLDIWWIADFPLKILELNSIDSFGENTFYAWRMLDDKYLAPC